MPISAGGYIDHGHEAMVVRGTGLLRSADDIGHTVVASRDGVPIFVKNVADVVVGPQPRIGIVGFNENDDM